MPRQREDRDDREESAAARLSLQRALERDDTAHQERVGVLRRERSQRDMQGPEAGPRRMGSSSPGRPSPRTRATPSRSGPGRDPILAYGTSWETGNPDDQIRLWGEPVGGHHAATQSFVGAGGDDMLRFGLIGSGSDRSS
jgi:hypothetical protein